MKNIQKIYPDQLLTVILLFKQNSKIIIIILSRATAQTEG